MVSFALTRPLSSSLIYSYSRPGNRIVHRTRTFTHPRHAGQGHRKIAPAGLIQD